MNSRFIRTIEGKFFNVEKIFCIQIGTDVPTGSPVCLIFCEPPNASGTNYSARMPFIPNEVQSLLMVNDDGSQKK